MSASLEIFGEHTLDTSILRPGGFVLDAGSRNFDFAKKLVARGQRVVAIDADPTVTDPCLDGVSFLNLALDVTTGIRRFQLHEQPEARCLESIHHYPDRYPTVDVKAVTIEDLGFHFSVVQWDAVKLDVEGAEYAILRNWPGPVARQISIEFHEHVRERPQSTYDEIFSHLGQWYNVRQHERERRHCAAPNFWDTLLVLKGLG